MRPMERYSAGLGDSVGKSTDWGSQNALLELVVPVLALMDERLELSIASQRGVLADGQLWDMLFAWSIVTWVELVG